MKKPSSDIAPSEQDKETIRLIKSIARQVRNTIEAGRLPNIELPVRGLDNVKYDEAIGYLELGEARKARTLTVNTARSFAQTLRLMATSRIMVESNDFATKREAYYISKNWGECRFDEQAESDAIMDDVEAMASMHGLSREQLRFYPESHGGSVAGRLTVIDRNTATGLPIEIDCANLGSGAYSIPRSVEHLSFKTDARFILAIETGGMFQRLNNHRFWETANCIIVEMGGVPTRATRRFIRLLSDKHDLPIYCFVDCDPYGFTNIYRTLKAGSGNAAHVNRFLCAPRARFLGVTPQDIIDFRPRGRDAPADRDRCQTRAGRAAERPLHQGASRMDRRHQPTAGNGRSRRAAGVGQVGPQLRHRRISASKTGGRKRFPAVSQSVPGGKKRARPARRAPPLQSSLTPLKHLILASL